MVARDRPDDLGLHVRRSRQVVVGSPHPSLREFESTPISLATLAKGLVTEVMLRKSAPFAPGNSRCSLLFSCRSSSCVSTCQLRISTMSCGSGTPKLSFCFTTLRISGPDPCYGGGAAFPFPIRCPHPDLCACLVRVH